MLTHLPLVLHICVTELGQHGFRLWLVAYTAPSHYFNQCWVFVNWTCRKQLQWNSNEDTKFFIHKNAYRNIVCEMAAILYRGRWVIWYVQYGDIMTYDIKMLSALLALCEGNPPPLGQCSRALMFSLVLTCTTWTVIWDTRKLIKHHGNGWDIVDLYTQKMCDDFWKDKTLNICLIYFPL